MELEFLISEATLMICCPWDNLCFTGCLQSGHLFFAMLLGFYEKKRFTQGQPSETCQKDAQENIAGWKEGRKVIAR
jgi:hypothetical protein